MSSSKEKEQLRAAIHYSIGKKCQQLENDNDKNKETPAGPFTRGFMALLTETTTETLELFTRDVEVFARHGKRSTVNTDDVKLLCRRNPGLLAALEKRFSEEKQSTARTSTARTSTTTTTATSLSDKSKTTISSITATKRKNDFIIDDEDDDNDDMLSI